MLNMMFVCVFPKRVCSLLHCLCTHTLQMKSKIQQRSRWCFLGRHSAQFCLKEFCRRERIVSHISLLFFSCPIHGVVVTVLPSALLTQPVAAGEKKILTFVFVFLLS